MPKSITSDYTSRPHLVVSFAYDGLCTFEFGTVVEVFGLPRPEMGPDWYQFSVCALDNRPLNAIGGFRMLVDGGLELFEKADTIIIPGWQEGYQPVPSPLIAALQKAHARGVRIMSICSGVFVLAAAGLLKGKRATTHWRHVDALKVRYPDIIVDPNVLYVDDGQVLTSAGSAAGIDLCLHVVRRDYGADIANKVARRLVVPPLREGGQAQFIDRPVPTVREGARLGTVLERMRGSLHEEHTISSLAKASGMSVRTFLRRFKSATGTTPGEWLIAERLVRAREILETTRLSMEDVASESGFGSPATLRHHFRERLGTSPAAYRARFMREDMPLAS